MYTAHVTEPIIGAAAFVKWSAGTILNDILEAFSNAIKFGGTGSFLSAGAASESVAAAMLLFAYDRILQDLLETSASASYVGAPVSVETYFEALISPEAFEVARGADCWTRLGGLSLSSI